MEPLTFKPEQLAGKTIAVLIGGPGSEREVSQRSGAAVANALRETPANVVEVDVTGPDFKLPKDTWLAFNIIHGTFGEDGEIQRILDERGVTYTGENASKSRLAFDKIATKEKFRHSEVPTSRWEVLRRGETTKWKPPFVAKAPKQGSTIGLHILKDSKDVAGAIADCFKYGDEVLIEEYFPGRELTVGILGGRALPIVEIVPKGGFYDYEHKYTKGGSDYFVPARLTPAESMAVQSAALKAHQSLNLEVYSRVDVLLNEHGQMNVLEVNTIPGMTETSLLPKAAAVVGISFLELCLRIAALSFKKGGPA